MDSAIQKKRSDWSPMIVFLMQSCWNTHRLLCSWNGNTISIIYYKFHLLVIIFDFWSGNAGFARNTSVICTFIRTQLLIWVIKSMGISLQQQMNKLSTNSELGQSAHSFKAVGEVIFLSWNSLKKKELRKVIVVWFPTLWQRRILFSLFILWWFYWRTCTPRFPQDCRRASFIHWNRSRCSTACWGLYLLQACSWFSI